AARQDLRADRVAHVPPAADGPGEAEMLDGAHRAIEGEPCHHLRVREVPARTAHLPDALIRLAPGLLEEVEQRPFDRPSVRAGGDAGLAGEVHRGEHLAVDVELELARGGVADAHRPGALVTREPR